MGVKNWHSIEVRMEKSFAYSFADSFPAKKLLESAKKFLSSLRPKLALDPYTGSPSLSFTSDSQESAIPLDDIFLAVSSIGKSIPTLLVIDEFQDIAFVQEAQARFRKNFQELNHLPIIIMGSKQHILSDIFANPKSPLAAFGQDLEFNPIPYEEYHNYIDERFQMRGLSISIDVSTHLQEMLFRIPEPINIVCAHLFDNNKNCKISTSMVNRSIEKVIEQRQSRYEQFLSNFTEKEEQILVAVAKQGPIKHYNSKKFLKTVPVSSRMVGIIINNLWNKSIIDKTKMGYRVVDPLLSEFLRLHR